MKKIQKMAKLAKWAIQNAANRFEQHYDDIVFNTILTGCILTITAGFGHVLISLYTM